MGFESVCSWVIYTLSDPRTPEDVRYVGVTHCSPKQRLQQHLSHAKHPKYNYHSVHWLRTLIQESVIPIMQIIQEGVGPSWEDAEKHWIRHYHEKGFRLTNHAEGGRGPVGCVRTPETKAKIAAFLRGKKQSPELVEKRAASMRGRPLSQEAKAKVSAGNKGKKRTPKQLAALRTARADPAWRERVSKANKETWQRKLVVKLKAKT